MQVLLIEDDEVLRASLAQTLDLEGINVISTGHYVQARRTIRANFPGVVLTDIRMPDKDGFDILALAKGADPDLPVVMLTGEGDVPMAIRAMKEGAYDFLEKPCDTNKLIGVLKRALDHRKLVLEARKLERKLKRSDPASINFPGDSDVSKNLRRDLRSAADSGQNILLIGDMGVGKRLAAHTIFTLSEARDLFEIVLAPEIDPNGFEIQNKKLDLSVRSLNDAQPAQIDRLFEQLELCPDVRLIASTTHPFEQLSQREFFQVNFPNLFDRRDDIEAIFDACLRQAVRNRNLEMPIVPLETVAELSERDWPQNLLELRSFANEFLERQNKSGETLSDQMDNFEQKVLERSLRKFRGKASLVADDLGLPRKTLYDRLARYGLRPRDFQ